MEYKNIIINVHDRLATVTINRPDKLNAMNQETTTELEHAFISLVKNDDVGAVILTGAGEKAFVAGTDIGELAPLTAESEKNFHVTARNYFRSSRISESR